MDCFITIIIINNLFIIIIIINIDIDFVIININILITNISHLSLVLSAPIRESTTRSFLTTVCWYTNAYTFILALSMFQISTTLFNQLYEAQSIHPFATDDDDVFVTSCLPKWFSWTLAFKWLRFWKQNCLWPLDTPRHLVNHTLSLHGDTCHVSTTNKRRQRQNNQGIERKIISLQFTLL